MNTVKLVRCGREDDHERTGRDRNYMQTGGEVNLVKAMSGAEGAIPVVNKVRTEKNTELVVDEFLLARDLMQSDTRHKLMQSKTSQWSAAALFNRNLSALPRCIPIAQNPALYASAQWLQPDSDLINAPVKKKRVTARVAVSDAFERGFLADRKEQEAVEEGEKMSSSAASGDEQMMAAAAVVVPEVCSSSSTEIASEKAVVVSFKAEQGADKQKVVSAEVQVVTEDAKQLKTPKEVSIATEQVLSGRVEEAAKDVDEDGVIGERERTVAAPSAQEQEDTPLDRKTKQNTPSRPAEDDSARSELTSLRLLLASQEKQQANMMLAMGLLMASNLALTFILLSKK